MVAAERRFSGAYLLLVPAASNIKSIPIVRILVEGRDHRSPLTGRPACRRGPLSPFPRGHITTPGREADEESSCSPC